jgi:hypothetical protein
VRTEKDVARKERKDKGGGFGRSEPPERQGEWADRKRASYTRARRVKGER